jgi:PHS family inorganic phosphate transporter-like MFS transporter
VSRPEVAAGSEASLERWAPSRTVSEALDESALSGFHHRTVLVAGMAFFTDAYDLFIIGIALVLLKPLWHLDTQQVSLLGATSLGGAFLGALLAGRAADLLGRKRVYNALAAIMAVAAVVSALSPSLAWLLASRFVLGVAIGGNYPVSATLASEYSSRRHRGRLVGLVFSMQALGLIVGPLVGLGLLGGGVSHQLAWRIMLGGGALPALSVLQLARSMPESPRYDAHVRGRVAAAARNLSEYSGGRLKPDRAEAVSRLGLGAFLANRRFLVILAGTAGTWFLLDYAFYGNTISTPEILSLVSPHASLMASLAWSLGIFSVCALPGYVLAVRTMDRIGHRRLQSIGFAGMAGAFALIAAVPGLTSMVGPFLALYGVSYFFTEFGPNTTTFVLPAECFPTSVRATGHGISAGVGKLGAVIGVYVFPILSSHLHLRGTLLLTAGLSLAGLALTQVLPEPARRPLDEVSGEQRLAPAPEEPVAAERVMA